MFGHCNELNDEHHQRPIETTKEKHKQSLGKTFMELKKKDIFLAQKKDEFR